MRTIALDLGARETSWCEVNGDKVVARGVVRELDELEAVLVTGKARVGFEACREAIHVHHWLADRGHEPVCIDTTRVRAMGIGSHGRKNDRNDAEVLAIALERGYAARAHVLSPVGRQLRENLEVHRVLTQSRARMVVHARGLAAGRGFRLPGCAPEQFTQNVRSIELPAPIEALVHGLLHAIDELHQQLGKVDTRIDELLAEQEDPVVERLASAPGVSLMVSAAYISVVDDPQRFRHASQVPAYLGLCPSERTTGGRQRLGSITKRGNSHARAMLVQAAWCILRSRDTGDPLVHWAHRVSRRRGRMRAAVAVARRLARILWSMWRDGTYYDPRGVWRQAAKGLSANAEEAQQLLLHAQRQSRTKLTRQRRKNLRAGCKPPAKA